MNSTGFVIEQHECDMLERAAYEFQAMKNLVTDVRAVKMAKEQGEEAYLDFVDKVTRAYALANAAYDMVWAMVLDKYLGDRDRSNLKWSCDFTKRTVHVSCKFIRWGGEGNVEVSG